MPEIYACGQCGRIQTTGMNSNDPERARKAAEDCYPCKERSEGSRLEDRATSRATRIAKATPVNDLEKCFSDDGDQFYATPDEAQEAGELGVFGATFNVFTASMETIIDSILSNHHEDASEKDLIGLDRLRQAVQDFNDVQNGGSYQMNDKLWQPIRHQETFAMIKPDATARGVEDAMLDDIRAAGFEILDSRRCTLDRDNAEWLYREHEKRDHFADLVTYTVSGEVVLMRLRADQDNAPASFRSLMGPTDRNKAEPHTLRAKYAVGYRENSIHGSDSPAAAIDEIAHFFPYVH